MTPYLKCYSWAVKECQRYGEKWNKKWAHEPTLIRVSAEVPEIMAHHATPVNSELYPTWDKFLQDFLKRGQWIFQSGYVPLKLNSTEPLTFFCPEHSKRRDIFVMVSFRSSKICLWYFVIFKSCVSPQNSSTLWVHWFFHGGRLHDTLTGVCSIDLRSGYKFIWFSLKLTLSSILLAALVLTEAESH